MVNSAADAAVADEATSATTMCSRIAKDSVRRTASTRFRAVGRMAAHHKAVGGVGAGTTTAEDTVGVVGVDVDGVVVVLGSEDQCRRAPVQGCLELALVWDRAAARGRREMVLQHRVHVDVKNKYQHKRKVFT